MRLPAILQVRRRLGVEHSSSYRSREPARLSRRKVFPKRDIVPRDARHSPAPPLSDPKAPALRSLDRWHRVRQASRARAVSSANRGQTPPASSALARPTSRRARRATVAPCRATSHSDGRASSRVASAMQTTATASVLYWSRPIHIRSARCAHAAPATLDRDS